MKHITEIRTQKSEVRKSKQLISFRLSSVVFRLSSFVFRLSSVICLLLSLICYLSSVLPCFAQTTKPDMLADDASFEYYKIIEQRNFFRPKKDIKNSESESKSKSKSKQASKTSKKDGLDFILTGVIEIKNSYKAIVEQKSSKKGFYVSVNEAIEDYTVKAIRLNKIIIEKDGKEFELKLQQGSKNNSNNTNTAPLNPAAAGQTIDIDNNISSPKTLRENTIQQIRSGTRGTK